MKQIEVIRFSAAERFLHFLYLIAFLALSGTGLVLFLPQLRGYALGEAGELNRLIHRLAAVALMATPILYLLLDAKGFGASLRWILRWGKADWRWLRPGLKFYWTGSRTGIPPQGKFNTGQKFHALLQAICFVTFVITGLVMWVWGETIPAPLFSLSVILHDLAFLLSFGGFLLHSYLSAVHPLTRQHIGAMVEGTIPETDAKEMYPLWHQEIERQATARRK